MGFSRIPRFDGRLRCGKGRWFGLQFDQPKRGGNVMATGKKSIPLALASMVAGIACMPVASFISTALGVALAAMSVVLIYAAG